MTVTARFLVELKTAAEAAKVAESRFRRDAAVWIAALEQERAFAFRRLNLMQAIAEAMASAESEEIAVASAFATLRTRLGWDSDSEARSEVIARFGQVVLAIFRAPDEEESANDVPETLAGFERWYAEARGSPFWLLFEHQIPDTPRVDF
jgi:hypothetical protein